MKALCTKTWLQIAVFALILSVCIGSAFAAAPKFIYYNGTSFSANTPALVATNATYIKTLPFDGITIQTAKGNALMKPAYTYSYSQFVTEYDDISGSTLSPEMTDNYAVLKINRPCDFYDSDATWGIDSNGNLLSPTNNSKVLQKIKNFAQAVYANGAFVGIVFDVECYSTPKIFDWADNNSFTHKAQYPTAESYQPQVRLRAKQIMQQIQAGFPGCPVLVTYGPEYYGKYIWNQRTPLSSSKLMGAFTVGLYEGAAAYGGKIVDLHENYDIHTWSDLQYYGSPGGFDVLYKHARYTFPLNLRASTSLPDGIASGIQNPFYPTTLMPTSESADYSADVPVGFMVYDQDRVYAVPDPGAWFTKTDANTKSDLIMALRRSDEIAVYYTNYWDWLSPTYVDAPLAPTSLKTAVDEAKDTAASRTYNTSWFFDNCQNGLGYWSGNTTPWRTVDTTKYDGSATKAIEKNSTGSASSLIIVSTDSQGMNPLYMTDYNVRAYVKMGGTTAYARGGILGRVQDSNNYYYLSLYMSGSTKQWRLAKRVAGTLTTLASGNYTWNAGSWYRLKMSFNGADINASVSADGGSTYTDLGTYTDYSFLSGKVGIAGDVTTVQYDDISVNAN